jgi:hypothetical protein
MCLQNLQKEQVIGVSVLEVFLIQKSNSLFTPKFQRRTHLGHYPRPRERELPRADLLEPPIARDQLHRKPGPQNRLLHGFLDG